MTIRIAEQTDADVIAQLHARSWHTAYRGILSDDFLNGPLLADRQRLWRARFAEVNRTDQMVLLDEEAGKVQGFACAFLDADPDWGTLLDNLHVVSECKGRGLGRRLMAEVAKRLLELDRTRLHLWAFEQNHAARRFYERLGGRITTSHAESAPDGGEVNAVRYCWSDLANVQWVSGKSL
jgi:ribosomal protein S18 acetylase RimI-like enzyme